MLIKNAKIIYTDRIEVGSVRIANQKIAEINPQNLEDDAVLDAHGLYLSPGFIDVHIHGAGGKDTMDATPEALSVMAKAIAQYGTTSFVPTTMTMGLPAIRMAVATVARAKAGGTGGANVLGVHLEGPFINVAMMRAQNPEHVIPPSIEAMNDMVAGFESSVIAVTMAPEMPGGIEMVKYLHSLGIKISIGHSASNYETAIAAIKAGASHATHLYNGMIPFHHREPGLLGAIFDSDITTEVLADGIHLTYPALRLALRQKGTDNLLLVTDAMMGCTMPNGQYTLGGQEVILSNGTARLKDGTLAGTLLTLDEAIRNLKNNTSYPLYELVKMATYNPARYCGVENHKGKVETGFDADLVLFDEDISVKKVFIGGRSL